MNNNILNRHNTIRDMINNMTRQDTLFRQTASKLLLALVLLLVGGAECEGGISREVAKVYTYSCPTIHV